MFRDEVGNEGVARGMKKAAHQSGERGQEHAPNK
jgi:hypothetical protein